MKVQYNYNGQHRILSDDGTAVGEWADYKHMAILQYQGKTYIEASQYGLLPQAETVYQITTVETIHNCDMQYIDARSIDHYQESVATEFQGSCTD